MKFKYFTGLSLFILLSISSFCQSSRNVELLDSWDTIVSPLTPYNCTFNDVWGFEVKGVEYAVIGSTVGGHVFEISEDDKLTKLGLIPSRSISILAPPIHRDYKTYRNYLYCVSDESGGLQIVDLNFLPDSINIVYSSGALFGLAHNIYIDTAKATMYVCGNININNVYYGAAVYSLADPLDPQLLSTINMDYIHDAYVRNDTAYFNCVTDGIYIYKFDNGSNPQLLGYQDYYPDKGFNHSGWLNSNGKYYVFADESKGMRIKMCDVSDPSDISIVHLFNSSDDSISIVHNLMWKDNFIYVSHYYEGLQIFDASDVTNVKRVAWYDTEPDDSYFLNGAWGVYPYLKDNKVLISDRNHGLFLFRINLPPSIETNLEYGVFPNPGNGEMVFYYDSLTMSAYSFMVYDVTGKLIYKEKNIKTNFLRFNVSSWAAGTYIYRWEGIDNAVNFTRKFVVAAK